jgi:EAL and modified HD-GYP domain-containing signal transduction protein
MVVTTAPATSRARLRGPILATMATEPGPSVAPAPGVASQAILDATGRQVGVELLYREPPASVAPRMLSEADHEQATGTVVDLLHREMDAGATGLLFLNAPRSYLVGESPLPAPNGRLVVEVLEGVAADPEVVQGVAGLVARGYQVALDDWEGDDDRVALLALAHFVKVDLEAVTRARLASVIAQARSVRPGVRVVVERIETVEDLQAAVEAGADLFQGYLLATPDMV